MVSPSNRNFAKLARHMSNESGWISKEPGSTMCFAHCFARRPKSPPATTPTTTATTPTATMRKSTPMTPYVSRKPWFSGHAGGCSHYHRHGWGMFSVRPRGIFHPSAISQTHGSACGTAQYQTDGSKGCELGDRKMCVRQSVFLSRAPVIGAPGMLF